MSGSPGTLPAPELPPERRLALIVATSTYVDSSLRQLRAPAQDAADLSEVLADPGIGGFEVTQVINSSAQEIRLAIEEFVTERRPDDLLVIYLSCHGLIDQRRRLYFAATDTLKHRLAATGVESQWLLDQMDDCRARRQVIIFDCCFSGAFARGAKGGDTDVDLGNRFHGHGRGRIVLTASRGTEYSFEGTPLPGAVSEAGSVFTGALVQGLRTGDADRDNDGFISVDEAYAYAFDSLRTANANQTPQRWLYGAEGHILLARSVAGRKVTPGALPESIRSALESPHPAIRLGSVTILGEWLTGDDPAQAALAREFLRQISDNDIPQVATAAGALLDPAPAAEQPAASQPSVPSFRVEVLPFKLSGAQLDQTSEAKLVKQIGLEMLRDAPSDWHRLTINFRAVGRHAEVLGEVRSIDDRMDGWPVSTGLTAMFAKLREGMYRESRGTWHNADYTLDHPSHFNLDYHVDEPAWLTPPPPLAYLDELRMFPRSEDKVPAWLTRRLSNVSEDALDSFFRIPHIVARGPVTLPRQPVASDDKFKLLDYLTAAPVVISQPGVDFDVLSIARLARVPRAFHTDGFWLWPASVIYYLRTYDVAPQRELYDHIRMFKFQIPHVNKIVIDLAARVAAGLP